eukprot:gene2412-3200_t
MRSAAEFLTMRGAKPAKNKKLVVMERPNRGPDNPTGVSVEPRQQATSVEESAEHFSVLIPGLGGVYGVGPLVGLALGVE